jgi:superfamily II DNA or RNA helicase
MSIACDSCGKSARVQCDCFAAFCGKCFKSHRCGNEHLAQFSSGMADYSEEVAEVQLTGDDLLRALPMRPYQQAAYQGVLDQFGAANRTLVVLPTGMGKTVLFGHVAANWDRGRVLIMAHRDELIRQAADKVGRIVGEQCDIEMGDDYADRGSLYRRAHVVVTSVQTMCRPRRQGRFNPEDFGLLVIDEAHHAVADSYRSVIEHFGQNSQLKILGVTARPSTDP